MYYKISKKIAKSASSQNAYKSTKMATFVEFCRNVFLAIFGKVWFNICGLHFMLFNSKKINNLFYLQSYYLSKKSIFTPIDIKIKLNNIILCLFVI